MWILVILTILFSGSLQAQTINQCSQSKDFKSIDFQNEFGPQRLQGGVSWCFAYAGADLLTHYLYNQGEISGFGDNEIVSATAMGLINIKENFFDRVKSVVSVLKISDDYYNQAKALEIEKIKVNRYLRDLKTERRYAWGEKLERISDEIRIQEIAAAELRRRWDFSNSESSRLEEQFPTVYSEALDIGGWSADSAKEMATSGICTESKVQSSFMDTAELLPLNLTDDRGRVDKLKILSRLVFLKKESDAKAIHVLFPGVSEEDISELIKTESRADLPFHIMNKACEHKPAKNIPETRSYYIENEKKPKPSEISNMFSVIDEQLNQKNAVVFSTDGDIFDYAGKPFAFETGHAILIVGKRFNCDFNEPEYIIRNSWGPNACKRYLPYFRRESPYAKRATALIEKRAAKCRATCAEEDQDEADPVRNCLESCYNQASAQLIEVNKPPYYCENGNYVVRKSHLQRGSKAVHYLVPSK